MNDFSELETELKKLRPAPVSDAVFARIERALQADATPTAGVLPRPASRGRIWLSLGLGLTAATALILIGLNFVPQPPAPSPALAQQVVVNPPPETTAASSARSGFQPSALTQVIYRQRDEGLVFSPNQSERLLRRIRYDTRETMQWRNPTTGASLRVSYPAEQVVLTPVSFQ